MSVLAYQEVTRRIEELTRAIYELDPYFVMPAGGSEAADEPVATLSMLVSSGDSARAARRARSPQRRVRARSPPPSVWLSAGTTYAEIVKGYGSRSSSIGSRQSSAQRQPSTQRQLSTQRQPSAPRQPSAQRQLSAQRAPAEPEQRLETDWNLMMDVDARPSENVSVIVQCEPPDDGGGYSETRVCDVSESESCRDVTVSYGDEYTRVAPVSREVHEYYVETSHVKELSEVQTQVPLDVETIQGVGHSPTRIAELSPPEREQRSVSPATKYRSQDLSYAEILALGLRKQTKTHSVMSLPKPQVAQVELVKEIIVECVEKSPPPQKAPEPKFERIETTRLKTERPERPFARSRSRDMPRQRRAPEKRPTKAHDVQIMKKKKTSKKVIEVQEFDDAPEIEQPSEKETTPVIFVKTPEKKLTETSNKEFTKKIQHSATVVETITETASVDDTRSETAGTEEHKKSKKKHKSKKNKINEDEIQKALKEIEESDKNKKKKGKEPRDKSKEVSVTNLDKKEDKVTETSTRIDTEQPAKDVPKDSHKKKKKGKKESDLVKKQESINETAIDIKEHTKPHEDNIDREDDVATKIEKQENAQVITTSSTVTEVEPSYAENEASTGKKLGSDNDDIPLESTVETGSVLEPDIKEISSEQKDQSTPSTLKKKKKNKDKQKPTDSVQTESEKTIDESQENVIDKNVADKNDSKQKKKKKSKKVQEQVLFETTDTVDIPLIEDVKLIDPIVEEIPNVVEQVEEFKPEQENKETIQQLPETTTTKTSDVTVVSEVVVEEVKLKKKKAKKQKIPDDEVERALREIELTETSKKKQKEKTQKPKENKHKVLKEDQITASETFVLSGSFISESKTFEKNVSTTTDFEKTETEKTEDKAVLTKQKDDEDLTKKFDTTVVDPEPPDWNELIAEEEASLSEPIMDAKQQKDNSFMSESEPINEQIASEVTILQEASISQLDQSKGDEILCINKTITDIETVIATEDANKNVKQKEQTSSTLPSPSNEQNNNDKFFTSEDVKCGSINIVEEITRYETIPKDVETRTIYLITHEEKKLPPIRTVKVFSSKSNSLEESMSIGESEANVIEDLVTDINAEEEPLTFSEENVALQATEESAENKVSEGSLQVPFVSEEMENITVITDNVSEKIETSQVTKISEQEECVNISEENLVKKLKQTTKLESDDVTEFSDHTKNVSMATLEQVTSESKANDQEELQVVLEEAIFGSVQERKKPIEKKGQVKDSIPYQQLIEEIKTYSLELDMDQLDYSYHQFVLNKKDHLHDTKDINLDTDKIEKCNIKNEKFPQETDQSDKASLIDTENSISEIESKEIQEPAIPKEEATRISYQELRDAETLYGAIVAQNKFTDTDTLQSDITSISVMLDPAIPSLTTNKVEDVESKQDQSALTTMKEEDSLRFSYQQIQDAEVQFGLAKTSDIDTDSASEKSTTKQISVSETMMEKQVLKTEPVNERSCDSQPINKIGSHKVPVKSKPELESSNMVPVDTEKMIITRTENRHRIEEAPRHSYHECQDAENILGVLLSKKNDTHVVIDGIKQDLEDETLTPKEDLIKEEHLGKESSLPSSKTQPLYLPEEQIQDYQQINDAEKLLATIAATSSSKENTPILDEVTQNDQKVLNSSHVQTSEGPCDDISNGQIDETNSNIFEILTYNYHELRDAENLYARTKTAVTEPVSEVLNTEPQGSLPTQISQQSQEITQNNNTKVIESITKCEISSEDTIEKKEQVSVEPMRQSYYELQDAEYKFASLLTERSNQTQTLEIQDSTSVSFENIDLQTKMDEVEHTVQLSSEAATDMLNLPHNAETDNPTEPTNIEEKNESSQNIDNPTLPISIEDSFEVDDLKNTPVPVVYGNDTDAKESQDVERSSSVNTDDSYDSDDTYEDPIIADRMRKQMLSEGMQFATPALQQLREFCLEIMENDRLEALSKRKTPADAGLQIEEYENDQDKPLQELQDRPSNPIPVENMPEKEDYDGSTRKSDVESTLEKTTEPISACTSEQRESAKLENVYEKTPVIQQELGENTQDIVSTSESTAKNNTITTTTTTITEKDLSTVITTVSEDNLSISSISQLTNVEQKEDKEPQAPSSNIKNLDTFSEVITETVSDAENSLTKDAESVEEVQEPTKAKSPEHLIPAATDEPVLKPSTISAEFVSLDSAQPDTVDDVFDIVNSTDTTLEQTNILNKLDNIVETNSPITETSPRPEKSPIHSLHDLLPEIDSIPEFKPSYSNPVLYSKLSADAPEFTPSYMYQTVQSTIPQALPSNTKIDERNVTVFEKQEIVDNTPDSFANTMQTSYSSILQTKKEKSETPEVIEKPAVHEPESDKHSKEVNTEKNKRNKKKKKKEVSATTSTDVPISVLPESSVHTSEPINVWQKAADDGKSYAEVVAEGLIFEQKEIIQHKSEQSYPSVQDTELAPVHNIEEATVSGVTPPEDVGAIGSWAKIVAASRPTPERTEFEIQKEPEFQSPVRPPVILVDETESVIHKPETEQVDDDGFITVDRHRRSRSRSRDNRSRSTSHVTQAKETRDKSDNRYEALASTLKPENVESIPSSPSEDEKQLVKKEKGRKSRSSKSKEKEIKSKTADLVPSTSDEDKQLPKKEKKKRSSKSTEKSKKITDDKDVEMNKEDKKEEKPEPVHLETVEEKRKSKKKKKDKKPVVQTSVPSDTCSPAEVTSSEQEIVKLKVESKTVLKPIESAVSTPESSHTPIKDRLFNETQFWKVDPVIELPNLLAVTSVEVGKTVENVIELTTQKEVTELSIDTQEGDVELTQQRPATEIIEDKMTEEQSLENKMADLQREIEEMLSPENDSSQGSDEAPKELTDIQCSLEYSNEDLIEDITPSLASPDPEDDFEPKDTPLVISCIDRTEEHDQILQIEEDLDTKHISVSIIDSLLSDTDPITHTQQSINIPPATTEIIEILSRSENVVHDKHVQLDSPEIAEAICETSNAPTNIETYAITNNACLKPENFWVNKHIVDDAEKLSYEQKSTKMIAASLPEINQLNPEPVIETQAEMDEVIRVENNLARDSSFWPDKHIYHDAECYYFLKLASKTEASPSISTEIEAKDQNDKDKGPGGSSGHSSETDEPKDPCSSPFDSNYISMDLPGGICSWKDQSSYLSLETPTDSLTGLLSEDTPRLETDAREDILTTTPLEPATLSSPRQEPATAEAPPRRAKDDLSNDIESLLEEVRNVQTRLSDLPDDSLHAMEDGLREGIAVLVKCEEAAELLETKVMEYRQEQEVQVLLKDLVVMKARISKLLTQARQGLDIIQVRKEAKVEMARQSKEIEENKEKIIKLDKWLESINNELKESTKQSDVLVEEDIIKYIEVYEKYIREYEEYEIILKSITVISNDESSQSLREKLSAMQKALEETRNLVIIEIERLRQVLLQIKSAPELVEDDISQTDRTIDSTSMPEEVVSPREIVKEESVKESPPSEKTKVEKIPTPEPEAAKQLIPEVAKTTIETQTGKSLMADAPSMADKSVICEPEPIATHDVSITCAPPQEVEIQTSDPCSIEKDKEVLESIQVRQIISDGHETIEIASRPILREQTDEKSLFVDANYKDDKNLKDSQLNIIHSLPQSFETVMVEPDETTTEVVVDADGTKRIIVKKVRKTLVTRQQTVQTRQHRSQILSGEPEETFSQVILTQDQGAMSTTQDDGGIQHITYRTHEGQIVSGIPGGEVTIEQYTSKPDLVVKMEQDMNPEEILQLAEGDGQPQILTSSSSVTAVVQQVTKRVVKTKRRIIRRVVIIDGKEHVTEEIIEEPDNVEVYEEQIPRVSINVRDQGGVQFEEIDDSHDDNDQRPLMPPDSKTDRKSPKEDKKDDKPDDDSQDNENKVVEFPVEESTTQAHDLKDITTDFIQNETAQAPSVHLSEPQTGVWKTVSRESTPLHSLLVTEGSQIPADVLQAFETVPGVSQDTQTIYTGTHTGQYVTTEQSSNIATVVQKVTRKITRIRKRIIKHIQIIDGKEHVTEEVIEEPEDVEIIEEEPNVIHNVQTQGVKTRRIRIVRQVQIIDGKEHVTEQVVEEPDDEYVPDSTMTAEIDVNISKPAVFITREGNTEITEAHSVATSGDSQKTFEKQSIVKTEMTPQKSITTVEVTSTEIPDQVTQTFEEPEKSIEPAKVVSPSSEKEMPVVKSTENVQTSVVSSPFEEKESPTMKSKDTSTSFTGSKDTSLIDATKKLIGSEIDYSYVAKSPEVIVRENQETLEKITPQEDKSVSIEKPAENIPGVKDPTKVETEVVSSFIETQTVETVQTKEDMNTLGVEKAPKIEEKHKKKNKKSKKGKSDTKSDSSSTTPVTQNDTPIQKSEPTKSHEQLLEASKQQILPEEIEASKETPTQSVMKEFILESHTPKQSPDLISLTKELLEKESVHSSDFKTHETTNVPAKLPQEDVILDESNIQVAITTIADKQDTEMSKLEFKQTTKTNKEEVTKPPLKSSDYDMKTTEIKKNGFDPEFCKIEPQEPQQTVDISVCITKPDVKTDFDPKVGVDVSIIGIESAEPVLIKKDVEVVLPSEITRTTEYKETRTTDIVEKQIETEPVVQSPVEVEPLKVGDIAIESDVLSAPTVAEVSYVQPFDPDSRLTSLDERSYDNNLLLESERQDTHLRGHKQTPVKSLDKSSEADIAKIKPQEPQQSLDISVSITKTDIIEQSTPKARVDVTIEKFETKEPVLVKKDIEVVLPSDVKITKETEAPKITDVVSKDQIVTDTSIVQVLEQEPSSESPQESIKEHKRSKKKKKHKKASDSEATEPDVPTDKSVSGTDSSSLSHYVQLPSSPKTESPKPSADVLESPIKVAEIEIPKEELHPEPAIELPKPDTPPAISKPVTPVEAPRIESPKVTPEVKSPTLEESTDKSPTKELQTPEVTPPTEQSKEKSPIESPKDESPVAVAEPETPDVESPLLESESIIEEKGYEAELSLEPLPTADKKKKHKKRKQHGASEETTYPKLHTTESDQTSVTTPTELAEPVVEKKKDKKRKKKTTSGTDTSLEPETEPIPVEEDKPETPKLGSEVVESSPREESYHTMSETSDISTVKIVEECVHSSPETLEKEVTTTVTYPVPVVEEIQTQEYSVQTSPELSIDTSVIEPIQIAKPETTDTDLQTSPTPVSETLVQTTPVEDKDVHTQTIEEVTVIEKKEMSDTDVQTSRTESPEPIIRTEVTTQVIPHDIHSPEEKDSQTWWTFKEQAPEFRETSEWKNIDDQYPELTSSNQSWWPKEERKEETPEQVPVESESKEMQTSPVRQVEKDEKSTETIIQTVETDIQTVKQDNIDQETSTSPIKEKEMTEISIQTPEVPLVSTFTQSDEPEPQATEEIKEEVLEPEPQKPEVVTVDTSQQTSPRVEKVELPPSLELDVEKSEIITIDISQQTSPRVVIEDSVQTSVLEEAKPEIVTVDSTQQTSPRVIPEVAAPILLEESKPEVISINSTQQTSPRVVPEDSIPKPVLEVIKTEIETVDTTQQTSPRVIPEESIPVPPLELRPAIASIDSTQQTTPRAEKVTSTESVKPSLQLDLQRREVTTVDSTQQTSPRTFSEDSISTSTDEPYEVHLRAQITIPQATADLIESERQFEEIPQSGHDKKQRKRKHKRKAESPYVHSPESLSDPINTELSLSITPTSEDLSSKDVSSIDEGISQLASPIQSRPTYSDVVQRSKSKSPSPSKSILPQKTEKARLLDALEKRTQSISELPRNTPDAMVVALYEPSVQKSYELIVNKELDEVKNSIEKNDPTKTERSIIIVIETISVWLEEIQYKIQKATLSGNKHSEETERLNSLQNYITSLKEIIDIVEVNEEIITLIETLTHQVEAVNKLNNQSPFQVKEAEKEWAKFMDEVEKVSQSVNHVKIDLSNVIESDAPTQQKLDSIDKIELDNIDNSDTVKKLFRRYRTIVEANPKRECPEKLYVCDDDTKQIDNTLNTERDRLMQLTSLAEEYEQTLQDFGQITDVAESLLDGKIIVSNLEHLHEEIQKHRKFFVNLSHCRAILESLEDNLDSETRAKYASLHNSLHDRATVIIDRAASRAQQMTLAASRWTFLEQGMREEKQWLIVAQQRVPDLTNVTSLDHEQYINLYQSISLDISHHYAKMLRLLSITEGLQNLIVCSGLETECSSALDTLLKLQEDVDSRLTRLTAFKENWLTYDHLIDRIEGWMKIANRELEYITPENITTTGNLRRFWELKAQHEVHNNLKNESGMQFEKALEILSISDEMVQRQYFLKIEDKWRDLAVRMGDLHNTAIQNISDRDVSSGEKLNILEEELRELRSSLDSFKGVIKSEDELNLYIERLQVMTGRIDRILNELGRLSLLPTAESERLGALLTQSGILDDQISEELERSLLLKEKIVQVQTGILRCQKSQRRVRLTLEECEAAERLGSDVVDRAAENCERLLEDLSSQWTDILALRQALHTLPTSLRVSMSPIGIERDISALQETHADLETAVNELNRRLRAKVMLWRRFERQLEMVQGAVREADYMVELLTVQGQVDYDRLLKATEKLETLNESLNRRSGELVGELKDAAAPLEASTEPSVAAQLKRELDDAAAAYEHTCSNLTQLCDKYHKAVDLWKRYRDAAAAVRSFAEFQEGRLHALRPDDAPSTAQACLEQESRVAELRSLAARVAAETGSRALQADADALARRLQLVAGAVQALADLGEARQLARAKAQHAKEKFCDMRQDLAPVHEDGEIVEDKLIALRDNLIALGKSEADIAPAKAELPDIDRDVSDEHSIVRILELWQAMFRDTFLHYHRLSTALVRSGDAATALRLWHEYLLDLQSFLSGSVPADYENLTEHRRLCRVHRNLLTSQRSVLMNENREMKNRDLADKFDTLTNLHNETLARIVERHDEVCTRIAAWDDYREVNTELLRWLKEMEREKEKLQLRYVHIKRIHKILSKIQNLSDKVPEGRKQADKLLTNLKKVLEFTEEAYGASVRIEYAGIVKRVDNLQASLDTWRDFLSRILALVGEYESLTNDLQKTFSRTQDEVNSYSDEERLSRPQLKKAIEKFTDLRTKIEKTETQIEALSVIQEQLKECLSPQDIRVVNQKLWQLRQQRADLEHQLSIVIHRLEERLEIYTIYESRLTRFSEWLTTLESRLETSGQGSEISALDPQDLIRRLTSDIQAETSMKEREFDWLTETGHTLIELSKKDEKSYSKTTLKHLKEVQERWHKVQETGRSRIAKITELLETISQLEERLTEIRMKLHAIESRLTAPIILEHLTSKAVDEKFKERDDIHKSIENESGEVGEALNLCQLVFNDPDVLKGNFDLRNLHTGFDIVEKKWKSICDMSEQRKNTLKEVRKSAELAHSLLPKVEKKLDSIERRVEKIETRKQRGEPEDEGVSKAAIKDLEALEGDVKRLEDSYSRIASARGVELRGEGADDAARLRAAVRRWQQLRGRVDAAGADLHRQFVAAHGKAVVALAEADVRLTRALHLSPMPLDKAATLKELEGVEQELRECEALVAEADRLSLAVSTVSGVSDMVGEYRALYADVRTRLDVARAEVVGDVDTAVQVDTLKWETDASLQVDTLTSKETYRAELASAVREASESLEALRTALIQQPKDNASSDELATAAKDIAKAGAKPSQTLELAKHLSELLLTECDATEDEAMLKEVESLSLRYEDLLAQAKKRELQINNLRLPHSASYALTCEHESGRLTCPLCSERNWKQLDNDLWRLEQWLQFAEATEAARTEPPEQYDALEDAIQDHREFLLDLDSHKSIVVSLNVVGSHVAAHASDAGDAARVRARLAAANSRWDAACERAGRWQRRLQRALVHNQQFHDIVVELVARLSTAERGVRAREPLRLSRPVDALQRDFRRFSELRDELAAAEPRVLALHEAAQLLRAGDAPPHSEDICRRLGELRLRLQSLRKLSGVYALKLGAALARSPARAASALAAAAATAAPQLMEEEEDQISTMHLPPLDESDVVVSEETEDQELGRLQRGLKFVCRVARASLPFQALLLLLLGAAALAPHASSDCRSPGLALEPVLRYPEGPPPL